MRVQNHYLRLFVSVILVVMHSGTGHATQSPINRFVAAAVPASPADAAASTHALLGSTVIRDANAAVPTTVQAQDSDQRLLVAQ